MGYFNMNILWFYYMSELLQEASTLGVQGWEFRAGSSGLGVQGPGI
jgi:hypothetical protein